MQLHYGQNKLHFWRTADGNKVDFMVKQLTNKGLAYEVKYNEAQFKPNKYKKFTQAYTGFEFGCGGWRSGCGIAKDVGRLLGGIDFLCRRPISLLFKKL